MSSCCPPRTIGLVAGTLAAALLPLRQARATEPKFFPFDVRTVFYISKSDDHNRVDYGIHLDDHCAPYKEDAVFQYWREFENPPPVRIHTLGIFEYIPYGISEQRTIRKTATGAVHVIKLRQFSKAPIEIITRKEPDGHCSSQARMAINGKDAELTYVYVKLARGGFAPSVDYVDVHGRDSDTGQEVLERLRK